jgi:F0F1-type ATP synthase membrane subunit b/b'
MGKQASRARQSGEGLTGAEKQSLRVSCFGLTGTGKTAILARQTIAGDTNGTRRLRSGCKGGNDLFGDCLWNRPCDGTQGIRFKPSPNSWKAGRIQNDTDSAVKDRDEAQSRRQKYEEKLKAASDEAAKIKDVADDQAGKQTAKIVEEGKAQAATIILNAHKQIQAERETAFLTFRAKAAELVGAAVERLLRPALPRRNLATSPTLS